MRVFVAVGVAMIGCYGPTVAHDVPCASNGDCPSAQHCDTTMSPPTCVAGDAGIAQSDARAIDARVDSPRMIDATNTPSITFVQKASVKPTAASTTLQFPAAVRAGDAIIIGLNFASGDGANVVSISDSLANTYSFVVTDYLSGGDQHYFAFALDSPAGSDAIDLELSAPVTGADWFALEYAGLASTNALDASTMATGNGTVIDSGPMTTTSANELVVGYAEAPMASHGNGFTTRAALSGNLVEDMTVTATGTYDATATTTSGAWTMIAATFRGP